MGIGPYVSAEIAVFVESGKRSRPDAAMLVLISPAAWGVASAATVCSFAYHQTEIVGGSEKFRADALKASVQDASGFSISDLCLVYSQGGNELRSKGNVSQCATVNLGVDLPLIVDSGMKDLSSLRADPSTLPSVPLGRFTQVRRLQKAIHGDVFLYRLRRSESVQDDCELVAVKKLRNSDVDRNMGAQSDERALYLQDWRGAPELEDALTEIGVFAALAKKGGTPDVVLRMLGAFRDESFTWLVTEYADGGELFDLVSSGCLCRGQTRKYASQLLQAVAYLHGCGIAHRDISLENVLLKDGAVRLMDFGMAVQSLSPSGTQRRYYREAGKDFYRANECYVPLGASVNVVVPMDAKLLPADGVLLMPIDVNLCEVQIPMHCQPGEECIAELCGYAAPPADIFSCAICLFILCFECPPWHQALLSDNLFSFVYGKGDGGFAALLTYWGKSLVDMQLCIALLAEMARPDPKRRPTAEECLRSDWFAEQL